MSFDWKNKLQKGREKAAEAFDKAAAAGGDIKNKAGAKAKACLKAIKKKSEGPKND